MNKFICLILLTFCYSHSFAQEIKDECKTDSFAKEVKDGYERILLYPDSLINHFPDFKNGRIMYYDISSLGETRLNSVYAIFHYKDEQIDSIKERMKSISIANYNFTDSCLLMTNCDTSWYTPVFDGIIQCKDCNNIYPVPNFSFLRESNLEFDFFEKAKIYVLKAEKGKFIDDSLLWNEGVGLSESWLHGYTKGVVISGNFVIYWLEVW